MNYLDSLAMELGSETAEQARRNEVLAATPWAPTPTTTVPYQAANRVLVIATADLAEDIEAKIDPGLRPFVALLSDKTGVALKSNAWHCETLAVSGHLGQFDAHIGPDTESPDNRLGAILGLGEDAFDQVLDCAPAPHIEAAIKPPGYYHIGPEAENLDQVLEEMAMMVGEFEKPRYFNYNPDICAHGRSGIEGCRRCIDACPTEAIISIGETIEVNPHLCQGGGTCAASCPTGAIQFVYPKTIEHP